MKIRIVLLFGMVLHLGITQAQLSLERQSIVSATVYRSLDGFSVESSLGQPFVAIIQSEGNVVTEGFHQPDNVSPLTVELKVSVNDCDNTFEVEILSVTGCEANASFVVMWNNQAAAVKTKGLPSFSTLRITTSDGCTYEQAYYLNAMNPLVVPCDLFPYNFVTPNGDGQNDYFHIENIERPNYQNAHVRIFNRWGSVVWEGKKYDNKNVKWTGQNTEGKPLPAGTYFFTIDVIGTTKSGYVELMQ